MRKVRITLEQKRGLLEKMQIIKRFRKQVLLYINEFAVSWLIV